MVARLAAAGYRSGPGPGPPRRRTAGGVTKRVPQVCFLHMVSKILITPGPARFGQTRKYAELTDSVAALPPDGALFVSYPAVPPEADSRREQVLQLRGGVRSRLRERGIVVIEDFDKGGVWVYRPAAWGPGNGRAVGPEKEAEVRRRKVDG